MFRKSSHYRSDIGKEKVSYSLKSALKASEQMEEKTGRSFSCYKCIYCDGYHIGKN